MTQLLQKFLDADTVDSTSQLMIDRLFIAACDTNFEYFVDLLAQHGFISYVNGSVTATWFGTESGHGFQLREYYSFVRSPLFVAPYGYIKEIPLDALQASIDGATDVIEDSDIENSYHIVFDDIEKCLRWLYENKGN